MADLSNYSERDLALRNTAQNEDSETYLKTSSTKGIYKYQTSKNLATGSLAYTIPLTETYMIKQISIHTSANITETVTIDIKDTDANYTINMLNVVMNNTNNFCYYEKEIVKIYPELGQSVEIKLTNVGLAGTAYLTVIVEEQVI
jgi:hypothetical protein